MNKVPDNDYKVAPSAWLSDNTPVYEKLEASVDRVPEPAARVTTWGKG